MKTVLSAAILAITLAWTVPVTAHERPSEDALWVPFTDLTYDHVERYMEGQFGDVVLVVYAGNRFTLNLSIHGDVLTTYGVQTMEVWSHRDIFIYVNGWEPGSPPLFSFDAEHWFPGEELFRGCFNAQFDGNGAGVSTCLIGTNPPSSIN